MDEPHTGLRATVERIVATRKTQRRRHWWRVALVTGGLFILADGASHLWLYKTDTFPAGPHPWWIWMPVCLMAALFAGPAGAWTLACCACADYIFIDAFAVPPGFLAVRTLALTCIAGAYTVGRWSTAPVMPKPSLERLARFFYRAPFTGGGQERIEDLRRQLSFKFGIF